MHVRENGRLDRNVKLFENLLYVLTHIGTYGSIWSNTHGQNFKNFVKELRERWVQNEKKKEAENSGDDLQKVCEVADTSFKAKQGEDVEESGERKIFLSGGS